MFPQAYYDNYKNHGIHFSDEILTRYCLSLKTKPFVILSGISGTGKTKIAQLLTVPKPIIKKQVETGDWIPLTVRNGLRVDGRGNLPFSHWGAIYSDSEQTVIKSKIQELIQRDVDDNITEPETLIIEDEKHGDIKCSVYLQRAKSPLLRVRFKSKAGEADSYDNRSYFDNYAEGDVIKLQKVGDKRLKVVSVNEKPVVDKEEINRTDYLASIKNIEFISVKSDWTDSTPIIGYYDVLREKYSLTPVVKFLLLAQETPEIPFFLIFDEMNLSKVEHYFSDFLSCIESRINLTDGTIHQEKIKLTSLRGTVETDDPYYDLIPSEISMPTNVFITGTVNIDETTYMFSPKVLDRANVLEFNVVDLDNYTNPMTPADSFKLTQFPNFLEFEIPSKSHYSNLEVPAQEILKELIHLLQPFNLHFGYRVINEISLFILNSRKYISDNSDIENKAIDIQILQKVLPKINGTFGKLDVPLRKMIGFFHGDLNYDEINVDTIHELSSAARFPKSFERCCLMYKNLVYNGFSSFIE